MDRRALLLLAAVLGGCSAQGDAESASPGAEIVWGGQTGSLTPVCGLAQPLEVQEGTRGFVIGAACAGGLTQGDVQVTDENGAMVTFTTTELGNGKVLVVPTAMLGPGVYGVSVKGSASDVTIVERGPAPTRLGVVTPLSAQDCGMNFELALDPETVPYAPWLRVTVSVDGRPGSVWADYGELGAVAEPQLISCRSCASNGRRIVSVTAEIAGESTVLRAEPVAIQARCGDLEQNEGCVMARSPASHAGALVGAVVLGWFAWRRSGARRVSRGSERGSSGNGGRRSPRQSKRRDRRS